MSGNMRGGWKVNATQYNRQLTLDQQYRQTKQFRTNNNFRIYVVVLAIVLLIIFG